MPFTEVAIVGETFTKPRSSWTPTASRPTPAVRAPRPTAMSTCSASTRPSVVSTTAPAPPGLTAETFTPVLMVIPRRPNSRATSVEASTSSTGSTRSRASSTVTWVP